VISIGQYTARVGTFDNDRYSGERNGVLPWLNRRRAPAATTLTVAFFADVSHAGVNPTA